MRIKIIPTNELPPSPPLDDEILYELLKAYALYQAYTNPFNPTTSFRYHLPDNRMVSLKVLNTLGQLVATLTDQAQEVGFTSVEWNALKVASGVYSYHPETTSGTDPSMTFMNMKKILLVK
jgi:hypothetical protein